MRRTAPIRWGAYSASGRTAGQLTAWSLTGTDASVFELQGTGTSRSLVFAAPPNFEVKDRPRPPTYQATVKVKDVYGDSAQVAVTVTVTNVDEPGTVTVTLPTTNPQVGQTLFAVLTEPDGSVTGGVWKWQKLQPQIGGASSWEDLAPDEPEFQGGSSDGATSPPYTVKSTDFGLVLRVRIGDYTDGHGSGKSASSPETRQVIKEPSVVRELKAASGNGQVRLSWKAPASTGGSAILRYERRHRLGTSSSWSSWTGSSTATSATVSSLTNGRAYRFEVRAVNAAGDGPSASVAGTPRRMLGAGGSGGGVV